MTRKFHGRPQQPNQPQQQPQPAEKPAMTFEVEGSDNNNQNGSDQQQSTAQAPSQKDILLALRARQAAMDVVLDDVTLMRAQSRLMGVVDNQDWLRAFDMAKEEVIKLRAELSEGATFEELVFAAEEAGEDIVSLAQRLGVSIERIADALDNRNTTVQI